MKRVPLNIILVFFDQILGSGSTVCYNFVDLLVDFSLDLRSKWFSILRIWESNIADTLIHAEFSN